MAIESDSEFQINLSVRWGVFRFLLGAGAMFSVCFIAWCALDWRRIEAHVKSGTEAGELRDARLIIRRDSLKQEAQKINAKKKAQKNGDPNPRN